MHYKNSTSANIFSLTTMLIIAFIFTYILSSPLEKYRNCAIATGITIATFPFASRVWNMPMVAGFDIVDWMKSVGVALGIIGIFFLGDAFIGKMVYPELPFYIAATRHIGFVITLFVTPILPIVILCTFRAIFLKLLNKS